MTDRSAWDEDFYDQVQEAARQDAEQDWAARYLSAWNRLEDLGVVSDPEDSDMTLSQLEDLTALLGP